MIEKIWKTLAPRATRRNIVPGLAVIALVNLAIFPLTAGRMASAIGFRPQILDTRLFYGPSAVTQLMQHLGAQGRSWCRLSTAVIDIPYALSTARSTPW